MLGLQACKDNAQLVTMGTGIFAVFTGLVRALATESALSLNSGFLLLFNVGSRESNSGPHAYAMATVPTATSSVHVMHSF